MKNHQLNFFLCCLFGLSTLASCGDDSEEPNTPQNPIIGVWQAESALFIIDGVDFRDYLRSLYEGFGIPIGDADLDEIIQEATADAEDLGSTTEFKSDGVLRITNNDGSVQSGTWSIAEDTLTINKDDASTTFAIQRLTDDELHLLTAFDKGDSPELQWSEGTEINAIFTFTR